MPGCAVVSFSGGYRVIEEVSDVLALYVDQLRIPNYARRFYWTHGELEDLSQDPATRRYALE
jgi:hypothetical protein